MLHFTAEEKFFFHIWLMIQKVIIIPGLLTSAETLASGIPVYLMIWHTGKTCLTHNKVASVGELRDQEEVKLYYHSTEKSGPIQDRAK